MSIENLNILFTTAHFPYPLIGGERIKQYNLIKHLSKKNKVYIVSLDRGYEIRNEYVTALESANVEVYPFFLNKVTPYINAALFSVYRHPMEIEFFRHSGFNKKVRELVEEKKIDLIINFFLRTAESVKEIDVKKILMAEDCRSRYQIRTSHASRSIKEKIIRRFESVKLRKYESEIINHFDVSTVVTEKDADAYKYLNPTSRIELITNGVDAQKFYPPACTECRKHVLFLGKLDFEVNIMMVKRIINSIYPLVKQENPGISIQIVGANPSKILLKLANDNIKFFPNVDDIVPFYQNAICFIHPHEGGSGIQNKLLEAMACECPVISTESGTVGIKIENGVNGYIACTDNEFASRVIDILRKKILNRDIGIRARELVVSEHDWNSVFSKLDSIIESLF